MNKKILLLFAMLLMGIYTINAQTWHPNFIGGPSSTQINCLLNDVHAIDANHAVACGNNGVILTTNDGGTTWVRQASFTLATLWDVYFVSSSTGWVVGEGVIAKTTDGGVTWQIQMVLNFPNALKSVFFVSPNLGWAVGDGGVIFNTSDGGTTWTNQSSGTTNPLMEVVFTSSTEGYAVSLFGEILKTTNGGTSWTSQLISSYFTSIYFGNATQGYAVNEYLSQIYYTNDAGLTWTQTTSTAGMSATGVYAYGGNNFVICGYSGSVPAIKKSTDNGSTYTSSTFTTKASLNACHFANANIGYAVGKQGSILKTVDGGQTWISQSLGLNAPRFNYVQFPTVATGYMVGNNGSIVKTTDGGYQWNELTSGTTYGLSSVHFINSTEGWAVGSSNTVLHTTDGGSTWVAQTTGAPFNTFWNNVWFSSSMQGSIVAGSSNTIYTTTDGGSTWVQATGLPSGNGGFSEIEFSKITPSIGWVVGVGNKLFKTVDGGLTWIGQTSGFSSNTNISSLSIINDNLIYILGDFAGVAKTVDGGDNWSITPNSNIYMNDIHMVGIDTGYALGNGFPIYNTNNNFTSYNNYYMASTGVDLFMHNKNNGCATDVDGQIYLFDCIPPAQNAFYSPQGNVNTGPTSMILAYGQSGFKYQLKRNGINVGGSFFGYNTYINLGIYTAGGVYTVEGTTLSTTCVQSATMLGSVTVICPTTYATINQNICQGSSYVFNGVAQTTSGTYLDTLVNAAGCDSIVTLNLTVTPKPSQPAMVNPVYQVSVQGACSSMSGQYVLVGVLNGRNFYAKQGNQLAWDGTSWVLYDNNFNPAFVSGDTLLGVFPPITSSWTPICIGACNTTLAIPFSYCAPATSSSLSNTVVGTNLKYYTSRTTSTALLPTSTLTSHTYWISQTVNGCESGRTPVRVIIGQPTTSTSNITACDSYTWASNNAIYTQSGTYTSTGLNANGCLHTSTLNLTITNSTSTSSSATACNSYTWPLNNQTYTTSGIYTQVTGCHIDTLNLTINNATSNTSTVNACDSYTWSVDNMLYTQSGTYTHVNGCHTEMLDLTITPSTSNTTVATSCDTYSWSVNNTTYSQSGTYASVNGCQTEILDLTITPSTINTSLISSCGSYTWPVNNTTYSQSGTYTSVNGCHTENLNLTINALPIVTAADVSACAGNFVNLIGSPAGGTFNVANPYSGPSTTYTYTYTDGNGCTTTSAPANIYTSATPPVTGVNMSNVGGNTATVNWNGIPGLSFYEIRYRAVGAGSWTGGGSQSAPNTFKTIVGLTAGTPYEIEVRGFCGNPNFPGPWSATTIFSTSNACVAPANLNTVSITGTTATMTWTPVPTTNYYQIRYRTAAGPGTWVSSTITGTASSKNYTGLTLNTDYEWQIRAICNPSPFSTGPWSGLSSFTTLASKPSLEEIILENNILVYPNPATSVLMVDVKTELAQQTVVKLYDISGRLVKQMQAQQESGTQTMTISLNELSNGMYTVQVICDDVLKHTSKISKQD